MSRIISGTLAEIAEQLYEYADSLDDKNERFVKTLIDKGIKVAEQYSVDIEGEFGTHKMGRLVTFSSKVDANTNGVVGYLIGEGQDVESEWVSPSGEEIRSGSINSLLALEFGTAGMALPPQEAFGGVGGQGTNSFYGHEQDLVWYFNTGEVNDKNKAVWKKATAIQPTQPMFHAVTEMINLIEETAKEVFGG